MTDTIIPKTINVKTFLQDNLDVNAYIQQLASLQEDEEGVKKLYSSLVDASDKSATTLQSHVFQNYPEFVVISKEISKLESDMMYIQGLINELKDMNGIWRPMSLDEEEEQAKNDDPLSSADADANANINGNVKYKSKSNSNPSDASSSTKQKSKTESQIQAKKEYMKSLYMQIENLEKELPPSPARYVVRDGSKSRFWEVNLNRLKSMDMVHIYLLSDSILVTNWRKDIQTGQTRMIVDKIFRLDDIGVVDVKDSVDLTNAFKIIKHPDIYMYRSETLEEKNGLLTMIKSTAQDNNPIEPDLGLSTSMVDKVKRRGNMNPFALKNIQKVLENSQVAKWLLEVPDELEVFIAHRDFDMAVEFIEQSQKAFSSFKDLPPELLPAVKEIETRSETLARLVGLELGSPVATKIQVQNSMDRLLRLNLGSQARDIFLSARTNAMRHRIRQINFNGSMILYVSELAEVVFRQIRTTCDWYGGSFREPTMASGFMKWVYNELEYFCDIIRRQVFDSKQSFSVIAECMQCTLECCKQLRDIGLDLSFLIEFTFNDDIIKSIEDHARKCEDLIISSIAAETFEPQPPDYLFWSARGIELSQNAPPISKSTVDLYSVLIDFASDVAVLMSLTLYSKIVWCLCTFFTTYVNTIFKIMDKDYGNIAYVTMLVDCIFVIQHILPNVREQLADRFRRQIPELNDQEEKLQGLISVMKETYIQKTLNRIVKHHFTFENVDYSSNAAILDDCLPSEDIMKLLLELNQIGYDLGTGCLDKKHLLTEINTKLYEYMLEEKCWTKLRRFGFGGVQQMILDIHLWLRICEPFITDKSSELANVICENGLRAYFTGESDVSGELKLGEWYEERVNAVMDQIAELYVGFMV